MNIELKVSGVIEGTDGAFYQASGKTDEGANIQCTITQKGPNAVLQVCYKPKAINRIGENLRINGWSGKILLKETLKSGLELKYEDVQYSAGFIAQTKEQIAKKQAEVSSSLVEAVALIEKQNKKIESLEASSNEELAKEIKSLVSQIKKQEKIIKDLQAANKKEAEADAKPATEEKDPKSQDENSENKSA